MSLPYTMIATSADRAAWLAARRLGIGASEIAAVLGLSRWTSPFALWSEKIGATEPRDLSDVEAVEWGLVLEDVIGRVYARRTGRTVRAAGVLLRSTTHPWALATLDAWTSIDGLDVPLEIKTAGAQKTAEWEEGPPREYALQVQHQMLVTGAPRASIACLLGGQRLVWCDVERDEAAIAHIVREGAAFWRRVETHDAPDVDGSEHTRRALAALYPEDDGAAVDLPAELMDADEALVRLKAERAVIDEQITHEENRIKVALGAHARGVLPDGTAWSWKTSERAGYTVAPSKARTLRRSAQKREKAA